MRIINLEELAQRTARARSITIERADALRTLALALVVALAAGLRIANLSALGYANHYYAAAVESMLLSWHNFFFVAAEPGASVSLDKPPVGFWLQTLSAKVFGVNTVGLLLPEIVCGLLSVMLIYHLVRRAFGTPAGLLAALTLAITPVVVATDRNNTIDSILIFTLLLAAWAFIRATEAGRLRYLLLGAALVGVGFNVKMLEAYLPLPAFLGLYFLGSKEGLWRKLGNLTLAGVVLLAVSLSWAVAVDLTPASQRPYVGSSGDNSELSLAIGYNGVERLLGMNGRGGLLSGALGGILGNGSTTNPNPGFPGGNGAVGRAGRGSGTFQPGPGGNGGFAQRGFGGTGGFAGFGGFGGFGGTGRAGATRLFTAPLSKEASWLLPFGILGGLVLAARSRPRWPIAPRHQALVLWGGWLLTGAVFFSVAGFFHEYYLSTLGPPLAALVGIGALQLWGLRDRWPWLSTGLLLAGAGATLVLQYNTALAFVSSLPWAPLVLVLLAGGIALLLVARDAKRVAMAGFACVMAAMLVTPGVWAGLTTANSSANQSLPAAYSGRPSGPPNRGGTTVNQALLTFLQAHTQGSEYLMAVPSSMQGADYVLATGRPVLYLGGFMGQDQVVTPDQLTQLVNEGKLRYIYWNSASVGRGFGGSQQADISAWVAAHCTPVTGFDTQTRNSGAPDGTSVGGNLGGGGFFPGGGNMQVTLYQCLPSTGQ